MVQKVGCAVWTQSSVSYGQYMKCRNVHYIDSSSSWCWWTFWFLTLGWLAGNILLQVFNFHFQTHSSQPANLFKELDPNGRWVYTEASISRKPYLMHIIETCRSIMPKSIPHAAVADTIQIDSWLPSYHRQCIKRSTTPQHQVIWIVWISSFAFQCVTLPPPASFTNSPL